MKKTIIQFNIQEKVFLCDISVCYGLNNFTFPNNTAELLTFHFRIVYYLDLELPRWDIHLSDLSYLTFLEDVSVYGMPIYVLLYHVVYRFLVRPFTAVAYSLQFSFRRKPMLYGVIAP